MTLREAVERLADMLAHFDGAVLSNERYGEGYLDGLRCASSHMLTLLAEHPAKSPDETP